MNDVCLLSPWMYSKKENNILCPRKNMKTDKNIRIGKSEEEVSSIFIELFNRLNEHFRIQQLNMT